ncbi:MAG: hypothetical protein AAF202_05250 [Pseudomonadota bacterium]
MTTCIKAPFGSKVDLVDHNETTMSLGIMINIVTGLDKYFVASNKYIINLLELELKPLLEEAESYRGWGGTFMNGDKKARMNIYIAVVDHMKAKLKGAEFIHDQLMSLSPEQQRLLLDMFLQLKGDNIPTEHDMAHFATWTESLPQDVSPKDLPEAQKSKLADIGYYAGLDSDLGFLEAFLQEESDNQAAVDEIVEGLREGSN